MTSDLKVPPADPSGSSSRPTTIPARPTRRSILALLTDAHCHPTDDPTLSSGDRNGAQKLAQRLEQVPLAGVCAMSSCTEDQVLVRRLAEEMQKRKGEKGKAREEEEDDEEEEGEETQVRLRPCFGYHPWYSHSLSLEHPAPPREEHYRSLLLSKDSSQQAKEELEALLPYLPTPRSLQDILEEIRSNLRAFPNALLGEVGLDRAFRIPTSREAVKDQPSERSLLVSEPASSSSTGTSSPVLSAKEQDSEQEREQEHGHNEHTLALRGKRLTSLGVPIAHQCKVLLAQIGVAVEEGRSISCHSVRAGEATVELIRECCRVYNGASGRGFRDVNLDLHSCTMSAEQLKEILRHHPNIYVSFSTTINARQKGLVSQLAVVPPTRLLVESDWHSAEQLAPRNWDVLCLVAPYVLREKAGPGLELGLELPDKRDKGGVEPQDGKGEEEEEEELGEDQARLLLKAARLLQANWQRFELNNAQRVLLKQRNKRRRKHGSERVHAPNGTGTGTGTGTGAGDKQQDGGEEEDEDEDEDEEDQEEEAEWERRMDFEDQWWKDVRAGALKKE